MDMAVSDAGSGAMEAKGPLTPPSDQMDVDTQGGALSNGHIIKDSLLDSVPSTVNSTQATSVDDHDLLLSNGVNQSAYQANGVPDQNLSLLDVTERSDTVTITSTLVQPLLDTVTIPATSVDGTTLTSPPSVVQPLTSDLRDKALPVSVQQSAEVKEQKQQEDLDHDLDSTSASLLPAPGAAETNAQSSQPKEAAKPHSIQEQLPEPTAEDYTPLLSGTNATEVSLAEQSPVRIATTDLPHHPPVPLPEGAVMETPIDPAPSPATPTAALPSISPSIPEAQHTSTDKHMQEPPPPSMHSLPTAKLEDLSTDQIMQDMAPNPPAKVGREREDDDMEDGPATKRSRTDDDGSAKPEFKVPDLPDINTNVNGAHLTDREIEFARTITQPQQKSINRIIQNIRRLKDAAPFNTPVDIVALNIPNYPNIITKPMDLRTIEDKLKAGLYTAIDDFVGDFNQIVQNTTTFNGVEHVVTKNANNIKASFDKQMVNLPGPDVVEPAHADKKKKVLTSATTKVAPPRRESRSSLPGVARSPSAAGSPQTFALGPQGVPLIRRDSTVGDGRPKREIHPPAPRDLPYANSKPKKKKFQWELKFCQTIITELFKPKYSGIAYAFLVPVDPVALNIPHYHKIIKSPMDLGTVRSKLDHGQYENAKEFEADVRLMFQNCYRFNPANDPVYSMGKQFEGIFDSKWAEKRQWIDANTPGSGPQSPGSSAESDEEEDDEEEEEEEEEQEDIQLSKLQQQIAAMSKQVELITQKKRSPPAPSKKAGKGGKPDKKGIKKNASSAPPRSHKASTNKSVKSSKPSYVTYEQKQDISNRINTLSEARMATALKIIRDNMPNLKGVQSDELELDIDELSDDVLHKLLNFVRKHSPRSEDPPASRPTAQSAPPARKKNKPMSKTEQEARIQQMRGSLSAFQNPGSDEAPEYGNAAPANDTSGDDEDSEESEEE